MKKRITANLGAILLAGTLLGQTAFAADGWQSGSNEEKAVTAAETAGESADIGLLGYIGNVTAEDRGIDIDEDGTDDYVVAQDDFIAVSVTLQTTAIATIKADDTPDFRCGTLKVVNENANRPVKAQIKEVNMSGAQGLKLVDWDTISTDTAGKPDNIALKVVRGNHSKTEEKDVSTIQDGNESTYISLSEKMSGNTALGYSLDGNYTSEMIEAHKDGTLPVINFVYKFTAANPA